MVVQSYNEANVTYNEEDVEYNGTKPVVTVLHPLDFPEAVVTSVDSSFCGGGSGHLVALDHSVDLNNADAQGQNDEAGTDVFFRMSSTFGTITGDVVSSGDDACLAANVGGEKIEIDVYVNDVKIGKVSTDTSFHRSEDIHLV